MVRLRWVIAVVSLGVAFSVRAGLTPIPNRMQLASVPSACPLVPDVVAADFNPSVPIGGLSGVADLAVGVEPPDGLSSEVGDNANDPHPGPRPALDPSVPVDANGDPIPIERRQPQRILGFMPNFRSVSGGSKPHPPGWKYNFTVATEQATDYSSFIFLGLTSLTAEGMNMHSALGKGVGGFYAYSWRGFIDKSNNTYLSAWLLPSLLHEDTRFYALGTGHSIPIRSLYVISRQGVARTYGGRQTPNFAGLGGKVLTQVVSRWYYPASAASFPVLATKFSYSVMRDVIFLSIREFYPDAAAHFVRKRQAKMAEGAAQQATPVQ